MSTLKELETRLAALEQRVTVTPQAVPPVTIGELADVPAPGSPIASQWSQEVSRRIVHRFATTAARDAAYPAAGAGAGAMCVTVDTGTVWTVVGTTWVARAALGRLNSVLVNADQAGITGEAAMTGFVVPITAVTGRRYRAYATFGATQATANSTQIFRIYDTGNLLGIIESAFIASGTFRTVTAYWEIGTLTAGAHNITLTASVLAGSLTIPNSSSMNGRLSVDDVGT